MVRLAHRERRDGLARSSESGSPGGTRSLHAAGYGREPNRASGQGGCAVQSTNEQQRRLQVPLEPVDELEITGLVDNTYDIFMPDQGPARRAGPGATHGRLPAATMLGGAVPDQLIAEHGLSLLLTVTKGGRQHRLLFDSGVSPDG